jgi:hypothetical protein
MAFSRNTIATAPTAGPIRLPAPPRITMIRAVAEKITLK